MATRVVTLEMDGQQVSAREDQNLLEVAQENGIRIPRLCYVGGLTIYGGCRLCLVEVAGSHKLLSACTTFAIEGMVVTTTSERLRNYRRMILELLFAERNHVCSVCVSNGDCELQALAVELELDYVRFPYIYPNLPVDASHHRFMLDQNRCVLCTRCVRVCSEVEGAHTWDVMARGAESLVITDLAQPWGDSLSCTSCGKCVHICPTGALSEKGHSVSEMHKHRQFLPYLTMMRDDETRPRT